MSEAELVGAWADEESRTKALQLLSTKDNYAQVIDALYEFNRTFETTHLQEMYQKVSNKIREVDNKHILFLEHSYFGNTGVKSSIERVRLPNDEPDPLVAYAPHGYDLVTDTKDVASTKSERVAFIFDRIKEKGEELNMPVWLGEWGAYYGYSEGIVPVARYAMSLIQENLMGNAYWSYDPGTEKLKYFQEALLRPFPAYTNGILKSYDFNYETRLLKVSWNELKEIDESTVIYIPWLSKLNLDESIIDSAYSIEKNENSDSGWLKISPAEENRSRKVTIKFDI